MQQTCADCGSTFNYSAEELQLFERWGSDPSPVCFTCNQRHHIAFRNDRRLYHRTCDATGQKIISAYSADSPYKVYKTDEWYSDRLDASSFGRPFDFEKPFFEQYQELRLQVPRPALNNIKAENSEFCNMTYGNRNCYLIFGGDFNEDAMFGTLCMHNRSLVDGDYVNESELCYMMSDSVGCYDCRFVFDSKNCSGCAYISDCTGCNDCILCSNLSQRSYCIRNEQLTKEEYELRKKEFLTGSAKAQQKCTEEFLKMRGKRIVKNAHTIGCEQCTGDYQQHSKNCKNCYDVSNSEDLRNVIFASKAKDCFQCSLLGDDAELCFETISSLNGKNVRFSHFILDSNNVDYSELISGCRNIFGCVGLQRKQYSILNRQYPKEEYEQLLPKVIEHMKRTGEWGRFFPKELSCFHYNESAANEYFPLSRKEAEAQGFSWKEVKDEKPDAERVIPASQLPDSIDDIPDDILNWAVRCEVTGRPFKIVPQELSFYRKMALPIPHKHPDERHRWRTTLRNPRKLFARQCAQCSKDIQTTYAPERPERVYCETCYLNAVY